MGDNLIILATTGVLFILLFLIPKCNRQKSLWLRSGYISAKSRFVGWIPLHRISLFLCIGWYVAMTHWNKKDFIK